MADRTVPEALKPVLDRLRQLDVLGVQSPTDVEAFIDAILELEAVAEKDKDVEGGAISVLAHVVREFRRHGIPVTIGGDGSSTRRSHREFRDRMSLPAREHGITLERGARTWTVIHEMAHAIPGGPYVEAVLGPDVGVWDEATLQALRWPEADVDGAPVSSAFITMAGSLFRDEAYAGLAVAALAEVYERGGLSVPAHVAEIRDAARRPIPDYVRSGVYLGDNHLLLYNLASLLEATQRMQEDPAAARREAYGTMPQGLLRAGLDGNPMAMVRRLRGVWFEMRRFLTALHRDAESLHPLKPLATRIVPIATDLGIDLSTPAEEAATVEAGPRPMARPRGSPAWIAERRASAEEAFALVSEFAQASAPLLPALIGHGEYDTLAVLAMAIPDEDLPRFWSMVLSQVGYYRLMLGSEKDGSTHPLLLPLVLQGYVAEARELLPGIHTDPLFAEQWVDALMEGFDAIARMGEPAAIDFWIGEVEGEVATRWMRRYQEAVRKTATRNGRFEGDGRRRVEGLFAQRELVSAQDIFNELHELSREGLYVTSVGRARRHDGEEDEIEDGFDFADHWGGTAEVRVAADAFVRALPTPIQIGRIAEAADVLRARGFAEASDRLAGVAARLLRWRIQLRSIAVEKEVEERYIVNKQPMRRSNTFLQHLARLKAKERDFLPLPPELVSEALSIARMPAMAGGGWDAALDLLDAVPESFTKAAAFLRLSRELRHAPPLADAERARFLTFWEKSLHATAAVIPEAAIVEPEEEGLIEFEASEHRFLRGLLNGRASGFSHPAARDAFAMRHRAAMVKVARGGRGVKLKRLRAGLEEGIGLRPVEDVKQSLRVVPTLYDPMGAVEEVFLKRNMRPRLVYEVGFDPNLFPLEAAAEVAVKAKGLARIEGVVPFVREVVERLPPIYLAPYVPLLLELSLAAQEAGNAELSGSLYGEARSLGERLRGVSVDEFERRYAYDGATPEIRAFDLQARYRRFQSTWEASSLPFLASLAVTAGREDVGRYLLDIRRIVDNESIFDVMGSAEYADAARRLDAARTESSLVADLFERAIQARLREQFEASYDVDHELAADIDASALPAGERDRLLALLIDVVLKRTLVSHSLVGADIERKRDFLDRVERMLSPLHALLDLVERHPYPETERALWAGLRGLTQALGDHMPAALYPLTLARAARLALERHPELVHPDARVAVGDFELVRRFAGVDDAVFASIFSDGRHRAAVAGMPSFWEIVESVQGKSGDPDEVLERIMAAVPAQGEIDPYVVDMLNAFFLEELLSRDAFEFSEEGVGQSVAALLERRGYPQTWKGLQAMAKDQPGLVRRVMLQRLGRTQARAFAHGLIAIARDDALPLEVRIDAFRQLARSGRVSDYLHARFEEARQTPEGAGDFLSRVHLIWDRPEEDEEKGRKIPRMLPDWLVAPLFEPLLAGEREAAEEALERGPVVDEEFEEFKGGGVGTYNYLVTAWSEPGQYLMRRYVGDGPYFLERLRTITANIRVFIRAVESGDQDPGWIGPTGGRAERDVVRAYLRNSAIARAGAVPLPRAFLNIHPTLRLVIADYIARIPASTRVLIMGAMRRTEERLGEDEVLRLFFELTGQEKLAQFLSVQEGVVPDTYRRKLAVFHEDLKPSTAQEVEDTLKMSGVPPGEAFIPGSLAFEHAGTVGELWRATAPGGRRLAIKVLPWKKERRNREAIRALEQVAADLQLFRHELFGGIDMEALYRRYRETLGAEMDYRREVANLDRMAPSMEGFGIAFPEVDRRFLRQNVMVMGYVQAREIRELEPETARVLLEKTGKWLAHAIFVDGFFYEDFHPGNIKWLPVAPGRAGQPLVFDFGRAGEFTPSQRQALIDFLIAMGSEEAAETARALGAMSEGGGPGADVERLVPEIADLYAKGNGHTSGRVQALFGIAARHGMGLEPAYLQFIKAILSWEGVMRSIDPDVDFSTYAAPAIIEALWGREPIDGPGGGSGGAAGSTTGGATPSGGVPPQRPPDSAAPSKSAPPLFGGMTVIEESADAAAPTARAASDSDDDGIGADPLMGGFILVGEDAVLLPPTVIQSWAAPVH